LKNRWNGAGLRKTGMAGLPYLIKWFLGITFKVPIQEEIIYTTYSSNLKSFINTLIGYLFYERYDKIKR